MPPSRLRVAVRQKFLVNAGLLALLALIIVIITLLYISSERNFHWWIDWYYPAIRIATAFRESPSEAIKLVQETLVEERNRLHVLPLVPFILTFGTSRLVYEVSLALVYLLPFALVMGGIAAQLIQAHRQIVFWSTALLTLLIPVSWVPTFMGIPDTGGAVLIGLATLVYLQDVRLKQWWRIPLIGFLIGSAILLRRHFVYGAIAFLGALTLQSLIFFSSEVRKIPQLAWRNLLGYGVRIGLIAAISFATIATVAWQFTYHAMTTDYGTLYTSWSLPFSDSFNLYAAYYGWATWLIVVIGFSASILTRSLPLPAISFIGLSGVLSLLVWVVLLRYGNVFYSLHLTPLVVIGLVAFIWTTWIRLTGKVRSLMLGMVACYLVSNLVIGLAPIGQFESVFRPLFALSMPPLVRTDYDEVGRLVKYLRQLAPNQEPIFVVGYQRIQLESSVVSVAELVLYQDRKLNILQTPKVDSRDEYPIETLLQAQYVVVPNPLPAYPGIPTKVPVVGEWLPNKEVDVVNVVFDAFTQNWEFAKDFKRLPVQFTLENGAVVSIYKRIRPTSRETAVRTFYKMQQQIGERPGSQVDWISLSQLWNKSAVGKYQDNTYQLIYYHRDQLSEAIPLAFAQQGGTAGKRLRNSQESGLQPSAARTQELETSFLYLGSLQEKVAVTGALTFLENPCVKLSLRLSMLNKEGQIVSSLEKDYYPKDSPRFKLSMRAQNPAYLLLDVLSYDKNDLINSCTLEINSVAVATQK